MFCDTHCHLFKEYYSDIDLIIKNAIDSNVTRMIVSGCDAISNREVLDLTKRDNIYGTLGIHPEEIDNFLEEDLVFIENNLSNKKIIAIGEIGLDYHYSKDKKQKQIDLFERQLKLAEKYDIPVVIHSREATEDTINSLKKFKVKGVIHSFSGSLEVANIYIKMGFLLGINGVITFKNSNVKEVYKKIGMEHVILETDSPYLTPVPFRGTTNEPAKIINIAEFVSDLYGVSKEKLAKITNLNIKQVFDI